MDLPTREPSPLWGGVLDNRLHLLSHREDRIEGGGWILEYHRDAAAAHLAQPVEVHVQDVFAFEADLTARNDRWRNWQNAQDGLHRGGLAAASLAHQPDLLAHHDPKVHPFHTHQVPT